MVKKADTTLLLRLASEGDRDAENQLLPVLYEELRGMADRYMRDERNDHTLQPTALVHEAYLRVLGGDAATEWESRAHFFRVAARAMRNVLVDHARAKRTTKRGSGRKIVPLDSVLAFFEERRLDILALHEALERLMEMDEELGRIVELRFFAGLTIEETSRTLGVSTPTIERRWRVARMWLKKELPSADAV